MVAPLIASLAALLGLLGVVAFAAPAHAVDYYRYWSYFHVQDGAYTYATQGVGAYKPKDGSIEAFRYAASAETSPNLPRVDLATATFDAICGDEDVEAGQKRVAVIIDFGVEQDADGQALPDAQAECASVPAGATGLQVLDDVEDARTESSSFGPQLCGIDGYPASGCSTTVSQVTPADAGFVPVELDGAASASPSETAGETAGETSGASPSEAADQTTGVGQDNDQDTEQGRGANPFAYFGLGIALFAIIGGGIFLARKRRG